jgi:glyoxylase-like metal-dependent hydrolase (beta-lactamase superfamily II)
MENLVTITYDSTHYYLIDCPSGKLLVDAGLAGSMPKFRAHIRRNRIILSEIKYILFTHHHADHAGIIQEIKNLSGARLLIHEVQIPFLANLEAFYDHKGVYTPIVVEKNDLILKTPNREVLQSLGINGEVLETPGHSPDSVSLVLDSGKAFIGDMNLFYGGGAEAENTLLLRESWHKLLALKVHVFYPAHAGPIRAEEVRRRLAAEEN